MCIIIEIVYLFKSNQEKRIGFKINQRLKRIPQNQPKII